MKNQILKLKKLTFLISDIQDQLVHVSKSEWKISHSHESIVNYLQEEIRQLKLEVLRLTKPNIKLELRMEESLRSMGIFPTDFDKLQREINAGKPIFTFSNHKRSLLCYLYYILYAPFKKPNWIKHLSRRQKIEVNETLFNNDIVPRVHVYISEKLWNSHGTVLARNYKVLSSKTLLDIKRCKGNVKEQKKRDGETKKENKLKIVLYIEIIS